MEGESGGVEYEFESYSVGDLTLQGVYRLLKEEKASPQWILAAIVVAPTGYWKEAEPEIRVGSTTIVEGDKGGIGEGIWRYGLGTAISKRFGLIEPYVGASYLFGVEAERKHTEYDRPYRGQVLLGAEFHVSPQTAIDLRGEVQFVGEGVEEDLDTGAESTEERHQTYVLSAQVYGRVAPGVTLLAGAGYSRCRITCFPRKATSRSRAISLTRCSSGSSSSWGGMNGPIGLDAAVKIAENRTGGRQRAVL